MLFHLVYSTWNYGHCSVPHTLITFMKQLLVLACPSLAPCEVFWRRVTRYCVLRAFLGLYFGFWTEVILLCHSLCSFSKPQTNHGKNICTEYLGSTICAIQYGFSIMILLADAKYLFCSIAVEHWVIYLTILKAQGPLAMLLLKPKKLDTLNLIQGMIYLELMLPER